MPSPDVEVKLDDINIDLNSDSTMDVDAEVKSELNADLKTEISVPDPITLNTNSEIDLKPVKIDSTFAIPEPIVMENESNIGLDIEPMAVDFCFKFELGPLPETKIEQPYDHHLGFTILGQEIFGFVLSGCSSTIIRNLPKKPKVVPGGHHHGVRRDRQPPRIVGGRPQGGDIKIRLE